MSSDPTTTLNSNHGKIQSIQQKDLALLTSGQVLLDLQSAVKELVENALDAGATNIGEWMLEVARFRSFKAWKERLR